MSLLVLGLWLGLLVSSWVMATVNFRTADRVGSERAPAELRERLAPLPPGDRRLSFRFMASEINRWMFRGLGVAQSLLGVALLALVWRSGGTPRALALACLAVVAVQAGLLAPMIAAAGRQADFMTRPLPAALARRFGIAHGAYAVLDVAKALLLAAAAVVIARRN